MTDADRRLARARLEAAGTEPDLLGTVEHVASDLAVDPLHCLVVEDSAPGVVAARAAGMRVACLDDVEAGPPLRDLLLRDLVIQR